MTSAMSISENRVGDGSEDSEEVNYCDPGNDEEDDVALRGMLLTGIADVENKLVAQSIQSD